MKKNKIVTIAIAIIIMLISAFIIIFWAIHKNIETTSVPEEVPQAIEIDKEKSGSYAIPDNAIPTEADIENRINKDKERSAIAEQAQAERRSARNKASSFTAIEPAGQPKDPAEAIPVKKELKFPTHEEREALESKSGNVSF